MTDGVPYLYGSGTLVLVYEVRLVPGQPEQGAAAEPRAHLEVGVRRRQR